MKGESGSSGHSNGPPAGTGASGINEGPHSCPAKRGVQTRIEIRPSEDRLPGLLFVSVPDEKRTKNRLHLDFRPDDRDAEVERLVAMGAKRADIGQGEQTWVVLSDPEGNEFCVLRSSTP